MKHSSESSGGVERRWLWRERERCVRDEEDLFEKYEGVSLTESVGVRAGVYLRETCSSMCRDIVTEYRNMSCAGEGYVYVKRDIELCVKRCILCSEIIKKESIKLK